jgi:hypothetical protein
MHPHSELNFDAFMSEPFHVMQPVHVSELKINLSKFYNSVMAQNKKDISVELINKNLMEFKLDISSLNQLYLKDVKPNIF